MKIFFAVLVLFAAFVCAVLCTKTRIAMEYKDGNLKITLRNLFLKFTFERKGKTESDGKMVKEEKTDGAAKCAADAKENRSAAEKGCSAEAKGNSNDENDIKSAETGDVHEKEKTSSGVFDNDTNAADGLLEKLRRVKSIYSLYKNTAEAFLSALRGKIEIYGVRLSLVYGTGNAAHTGMLYGAFWSMIGGAYAYLCRFFSFEFPKMQISPDFNQKRLESEFEGIIAVRLAHIITAALKAYRVYKSDSGRGIFDIIREQKAKKQGVERD